MGFDVGPVPVSEVDAYIRIRYPQWGVDDRMEFLDLVARLDQVYFEMREKLKPSGKGD